MAEKRKDDVKAGLTELPVQTPAPRRFKVKLQDCPEVVLEAADGHEAEKKYRKHCGILKTENEFEINEVVLGSEPGEDLAEK